MNDAAKRAIDALIKIVEDESVDDDVRIRAAGTVLASHTVASAKVEATA